MSLGERFHESTRAERAEPVVQLVREASLRRGGRTTGFLPDGRLCSGGATVYDFSGFDLNRPTGR